MYKRVAIVFMIVFFMTLSATAAEDHKPRRGKHYISQDKLGTTTTEDLEKRKVIEKESFLDDIKNDRRLTRWITWWRSCDKTFNIETLIDAGIVLIDGDWQSYGDGEMAGPNKEFLISRGNATINPVWGRMKYVKRDGVWHAEMNNAQCGVMLYRDKMCRAIVHCGQLDGVFEGFWVDKERVVITGYRKISPEMNAECEAKEVGECIAAILWLVDLTDDTVWEYRGPVVTFSQCEPNDFLAELYPDFFVRDGAKR